MKQDKLKDYVSHDRFWDYFKRSKMWKQIFTAKESIIGFLLAIITEILIVVDMDQISYLRQVLDFKIGFILLAIISVNCLIVTAINLASVIRQTDYHFVMQLCKLHKYSFLMNIVFLFYYNAMLIGLSIVLSIINAILIPNMLVTGWLFNVLIFLNLYLFYYMLILSVMLFGTNLRFISVINYWRSAEKDKK